jgi:hypothetical protein
VDSMHSLLENMAQFQIRNVLKLTTADANAKSPAVIAFNHRFRKPLDLEHPDRQKLPPRLQLDEKSMKDVAQIHVHLTSPLSANFQGSIPNEDELVRRLQSRRKAALQFVYEDLGLGAFDGDTWKTKTKDSFAHDLLQWVSRVVRTLLISSDVSGSVYLSRENPRSYLLRNWEHLKSWIIFGTLSGRWIRRLG